MSAPQDGGPAFPVPQNENFVASDSGPGMSLRDWFAGQALTGYLANEHGAYAVVKASASPDDANRRFAITAYDLADAMLAERAKTK